MTGLVPDSRAQTVSAAILWSAEMEKTVLEHFADYQKEIFHLLEF